MDFHHFLSRLKKWRPPSIASFEHHVNVVDKSIGIHIEHRIRRHIIDCPHIYPSFISLYTSFRVDFGNIAAYCAVSVPCYRTALQRKNRRRIGLQHAPKQVPRGFLDCFGGHVQSRAADVERILGRKNPGGSTPQLELLLCSHFPICFDSKKIAACIPLTFVPVERSFSTLKRLKTYLRNTMGEKRLNGLAVMNVHRGIQLDIGGVLDRMSKKNWRVDFLL